LLCGNDGPAIQSHGEPGYDNGFELSVLPERLSQPLRRQKATMYFVSSMSDLFRDDVPFGFIDQVIGVVESASWGGMPAAVH
jgi:protein gp37